LGRHEDELRFGYAWWVRRCLSLTIGATAAMCSGPVAQQPPIIWVIYGLTNPPASLALWAVDRLLVLLFNGFVLIAFSIICSSVNPWESNGPAFPARSGVSVVPGVVDFSLRFGCLLGMVPPPHDAMDDSIEITTKRLRRRMLDVFVRAEFARPQSAGQLSGGVFPEITARVKCNLFPTIFKGSIFAFFITDFDKDFYQTLDYWRPLSTWPAVAWKVTPPRGLITGCPCDAVVFLCWSTRDSLSARFQGREYIVNPH